MMVLVTYDVNTENSEGRKRLRQVAKACVNKGQRVQNSVFECLLDPTEFAIFKDEIEKLIDPEKDSLRYYFLGKNWKKRVEHVGAKETYDPEETMVI
ncbi:CRISPR-associated endonuclease Cas2 [Tindallia californiensis]|uniref:CRISPR-associated endoribonuclease Cas2 n=1 Tax=Tindallia californiensis TaxID=159292 RepID=A0A1H3RA09_9FIRM|nr:CRISPR-associated endonuclease Cas2 [Tindallia californiensis]SDZ22662.1 CRISPR-associated protein, Cas2 family [Tindallia californiensis]